ncbi:MAG TPA: hypothetical protein VFZ04_04560, partial [Longimicrobiales bacterium]
TQLDEAVRAIVDAAPADAVIGIRCLGQWHEAYTGVLSAARLRAIAPASMNVEVRMASSHTQHVHG